MVFLLDLISLSNGKHSLSMHILSKTFLFSFLFVFFFVKCKILLHVHLLGSKIKTKLKGKFVKALTLALQWQNTDIANPNTIDAAIFSYALQNGSGRENVQKEEKEEKKPRLGENLLHVLISWWKWSNDQLTISRSSQLRKWEFPVFVTQWEQ